MKKVILLSFFLFSVVLAIGQSSIDPLVKATWSKILKRYESKSGGKINTFDVDGNWVEWPVLFQPVEGEKAEEIDNMEFHMSLPDKPVSRLSDLINYAPVSLAEYKTVSFDASEFEGKDAFKEALLTRFGSAKNIYCLSNELKSPDEYVVILFSVQKGVAKMIGFWIKYYGG